MRIFGARKLTVI